MTSSRMLRPVLTLLAGGLVASCGSADGDANRFASLAQHVADIPVDGQAVARTRPAVEATAAERGLRPAFPEIAVKQAGLKVEVMDPHDLWDSRDGLRPAFPAGGLAIEPKQRQTIVRFAPEVRPVVRPENVSTGSRKTIQLGAYSSPEAAHAAWAAARSGRAAAALQGLTPDFEAVKVNGRSLVRLRVSAPSAAAAAVCRAAEVADPWCLRGV